MLTSLVRGSGRVLATALLLTVSGSVQAQTMDDPNLVVTTYITDVTSPTSLSFLGPDDVLVLERETGQVRRFLSGTPVPSPVLDLDVSAEALERGLLGIAVNTENPPKVFLYYTKGDSPDDLGEPLDQRVERYTWNPGTGKLELPTPILILSGDSTSNNGGAILLGPTPTPGGPVLPGDGSLLYVVVGDKGAEGQLQNQPAGGFTADTSVIFRLMQDGAAASGNPLTPFCSVTTTQTCQDDNGCPDSETCRTEVRRYLAYGVRNSFGMAFDPVTSQLWDTENGDAVFDEVNRVTAGSNSGWTEIQGPVQDPNALTALFTIQGSTYEEPEFSWENPIAPTALLFLSGSQWGPDYDDSLLIASFNNPNGELYRLTLNPNRTGFSLPTPLVDLVANNDTETALLAISTGFGITTDLELGPDGAVYVASLFEGKVYRIGGIPTQTPTVTPTGTPTQTPTVTPTVPTATFTPTVTGTPPTATPTVTETPSVPTLASPDFRDRVPLTLFILLAAVLAVQFRRQSATPRS